MSESNGEIVQPDRTPTKATLDYIGGVRRNISKLIAGGVTAGFQSDHAFNKLVEGKPGQAAFNGVLAGLAGWYTSRKGSEILDEATRRETMSNLAEAFRRQAMSDDTQKDHESGDADRGSLSEADIIVKDWKKSDE